MTLSIHYLDKILLLSDELTLQKNINGINTSVVYVNKHTNLSEIESVIKNWINDSTPKKKIEILFEHTDILLSFWMMHLPYLFEFIYAAGGLIHHHHNGYLFIYKRGFWDLPKGKIDKYEQPQEAAIRECKEETGINSLIIKENLGLTYHIFYQKNKWQLKITQWYLMDTDDSTELIPQKEEGIEKVQWIKEEDIQNIVIPHTYPSVIEVLNKIVFTIF